MRAVLRDENDRVSRSEGVVLFPVLQLQFVKSCFCCLLLFHLFQDGRYHVEGGSFTRIFVHADADQFGHVRARTGWYRYSQAFQGDLEIVKKMIRQANAHSDNKTFTGTNLEAGFHWRKFSERYLTGSEFPQKNGKAPHIGRLDVDLFSFLLKSCLIHPNNISAMYF